MEYFPCLLVTLGIDKPSGLKVCEPEIRRTTFAFLHACWLESSSPVDGNSFRVARKPSLVAKPDLRRAQSCRNFLSPIAQLLGQEAQQPPLAGPSLPKNSRFSSVN